MGKIKWTEKAGGHLQAIHDFIARDSRTYATRFVTSLIQATEKLKKMPYCGRVVPEFEQDELREVIYHGYRIVRSLHSHWPSTPSPTAVSLL